MVFASLFRRKVRTLLTAAGIAVGVAAIVSLGAAADGFQAGYANVLGGGGTDLLVTQSGSYDITLSAIPETTGAKIAAMPEVAEVASMVMGNVTSGDVPYFFVFGYDPAEFAIEHFKIVEGLPLANLARSERTALLGHVAADTLKKQVGDTLLLGGSVYRVGAIFETGSAFEESGAIIPLDEAQRLLQKHRQVSAYKLRLKDLSTVDRLRARIARQGDDLALSTSADYANRQQMIASLRAFAWGIAFLAVVIGGVGMMNTMLMSVLERTREIGTLRAVGWSQWRVMRLILGESLILSLIGGLLGLALGAGLIELMSRAPALIILQGQVTTALLVQALVVALLLGAVGGVYPAWRASRMTPIEALGYEGGSGARSAARRLPGGMPVNSLWQRKARTLFTMLGIGIGIASIVTFGSMAAGAREMLTSFGTGGEADLMVRQADASDLGYSAVDQRIGRQLAALSDVEAVSGVTIGVFPLEDVPFFIVFGYHPNELAIRHFTIVEGEPLTASRQIIVGRSIADQLDLAVGDSLRLPGMTFRVAGIYETGMGWEQSGGVVSLREAQQLLGRPRQVSMYLIKLRDPWAAEAVMEVAAARFPEIAISTTAEFADSLPDLQNSDAMYGAITVLALLVGGLGMTNTLAMSVYERTREIGTLRALGWSRSRVLRLLIGESVLLGVLGGLAGVGLGYLFTYGLQSIPGMGEIMDFVKVSGPIIAQALFIALVLGALGGLYPAWRASRLEPAEALRYE